MELQLKSAARKNPAVIEYTARDTPQQNLPVEVGFYALVNKAHATMHHVNLPMEMQYQLFVEIFTTVSLLDGFTVIELNGKCALHYSHFFGETPGFAWNLCTVGEVGTVEIKTDTTPKLEDHSVHCLFVGYSLTHPTRCYRMYDLKMHMVHISHDVVWLHWMFYWKTNTVGELNTHHISIGNWSSKAQGVS